MANIKRDQMFSRIWGKAKMAGIAAGDNAIPAPMMVAEHKNMMDDSSPVEKKWLVPDGMCGFGWVTVRPGNCAFANWLKRTGHGRTDSYAGGVIVWISEHRQSYTRKVAHADAMASVLRDNGIKAWGNGRLD